MATTARPSSARSAAARRAGGDPDRPLPAGPRMPRAAQTLGWITRPVGLLRRARERHGDAFTLRIAAEAPWVVLSDPDAIREVFTGDPALLRAGEGNQILLPILGPRSVLLLDGPEHLRERKLLLPPFHGERMQRYGPLMREIAEAEVARWTPGEALSLAPRMQALTLEIILRTVFGTGDGPRHAPLRSALAALLDFSADPRRFALVVAAGPERATRLPSFARVLRPVDRLIAEEIAERRTATDLADRDDVLSMLLLARTDEGEPMTDAELRDELVTLLVAGHETTATALSWAVERLVRHPQVLGRLREELLDGGQAYLRAVCVETLRLRPVLPVVLRRLAEPMTIAGMDLPAGCNVAPCISLVHRRADVHPEPLAFRPERWLDRKPGTYTWIPFGGGTRRCLGAAFAMFEMEAVLAALVTSGPLSPARPADERTTRRMITFAPQHGAEVVPG